jgi:oligosaccharide reducing-end xylanase
MSWRFSAARWSLVLLLQGCGTTVDAVGYNGSEPGDTPRLRPLRGPATYPNAFRDVLGKTEAEITTRIDDSYQQLFHGDPSSEAIYFETGETAYVEDILHADVRTEGMGFGMMITLQLDERDEFDRLWRYVDSELRVTEGPDRGYLRSRCDSLSGSTVECLDPYGLQQILMALVFAHGRWGSDGEHDYEAEALALLDVIRNKETENGGVKDGVTNTFDAVTQLVFDVPNESASNFTRPALEMPAYYELWSQATGDPFYARAAASGREYWKRVAHEETGLMPVRAFFDGQPLPDWDSFAPDVYRALLNIALDGIWSPVGEPWREEHSNRMLSFFADRGIGQYGRSYTLDGEPLETDREPALIVSNGAIALISSHPERAAFIEAVWNQPLSLLDYRYYSGSLQLLSLLVLSGRFQVY